MKKILIIVALSGVALSILISSCTKDITLAPTSGVTLDTYFKTSKDITAALAGIYSQFQEEMTGDGTGSDEGYGGRYHYWGEVRSDDFDRSGYATTSTTELSLNALTNGNVATDWGGLYRVISRCNVAIKYIPQVSQYDNNVTSVVTNNSLAQCYAMRAESYFYIIRLWGDAPIWTEPYLDITQSGNRTKSSKQVIIDSLIIPDLQKAYNLISKGTVPSIYYINEGAIDAIAADVYMWRAGVLGGGTADYNNATTWFNRLYAAKNQLGTPYGSTGTTLETQANWKNIFLTPTTSTEAIWSIYWDNTVNGCACIPVSIAASNNPVKVDSTFQVKWKKLYKTDTRVAKTIDTLGTTGHIDKIYKYYNLPATGFPSTPAATTYNVILPMYRLTDMYLLNAEALAHTNDFTNAVRYLNYSRARALVSTSTYVPLTAAQFTTMDQLIDAILQERQYELFGEGKRWFDLIREGRVNAVMDPIIKTRLRLPANSPTGGFGTDLNKIYWPISRTALNSNKSLVQNPSY